MASKTKSREEVIEYVIEHFNDERIHKIKCILCSGHYVHVIHDEEWEMLFVSSSEYFETYLIMKKEIKKFINGKQELHCKD